MSDQFTRCLVRRHFNEVFFTDVRVPDSQRLGCGGAGVGVLLTTLMNERSGRSATSSGQASTICWNSQPR